MTYELTRIKCYAWHNLMHQDLDLRGGDVLAIGASETGKTTLLDSIQLLVTGDMDTQWNTAANPTISKTDLKEHGRKLHHLLIRKQDDGTVLRPDGVCVGYFALELIDSATQTVLSLALGARTLGHASRHVEKWWFLAPIPLASVQFTDPQDAKTLLDKDPFKQANGAENVYDTGRYRVRLARELFPGVPAGDTGELVAHLERWTNFLNVGKSYGRLKEQSIDQLIRDALPAPRLEAFEEAKKGLMEIQSIRTKLDEARKQLESLQGIHADLTTARRHHLTLCLTEYGGHYQEHRSIQNQQTKLMARHRDQGEQAEGARLQALSLATQLQAVQDRLQAILDPTKVALVAQHDSLQRQHSEAVQSCTELDRRREKLGIQLSELARELDRMQASIGEAKRTLKAKLLALAAAAPEELTKDIEGYADAVERDDDGDMEIVRARIMRDAAEAQSVLAVKLSDLQREARGLDARRQELEAESHALKAQKSIAPLEDLGDALELVGDRATPLYLGIEVKDGQEKVAVLLQEFLGPRILGALVPTEPEYVARLRKSVHAKLPHILVVDTADLTTATVLAGPLACIDTERSNPDVVRFLASEYGDVALLDAGQQKDEHARAIWRDGNVYADRTWRIDTNQELRFLGQVARERARLGRLAAIDAETKAIAQTSAGLRTRQENTQKRKAALIATATDATGAYAASPLPRLRATYATRQEAKAPLAASLAEAGTAFTQADTRRLALNAQLQEAKKLVQRTGADKMMQERDRIEDQRKDLERQRDDARTLMTECSTRSQDALDTARNLDAPLKEAFRKVTESRRVILALRPMTHDEFEELVKEDGALEMSQGSRVTRTARVGSLFGEHVKAVKQAVVALPQSENMLFDEARLVVHTTHSNVTLEERIKQLADATKTERERQQGRIAQIYTDQVITPIGPMLKHDLDNTEQLISGINRQLRDIPFNHRRYQLGHARSPEASADLVRLIQDFTPTNYMPLQEFLQRKFLDEGTTVEELQGMFDYRKWYTFALRRTKAGSEDYGEASTMASSGGAQAAPHYILVYAMLRLLYETTQSRVRIILLDEAFRGVDAGNKPVLYEMGKQLGLTLIVANTEFEGHSTLRTTADVLTFTKNLHSETFIEKWSQRKHVAQLAR